ncbi:MAG: tetratricopeptide repeat protein, partial [Pyrinomonadaceae bacterium]|nr:tetratricopeptide repeat protein [Pyrinomonadaceae bacterium]
NAVRYVRRYGGADVLLDYYLKLSAEAFKNYRWNVVLARIYEANQDSENAVKNYRTAIVNQPEMPELYLAIAEIETKRNDFDAALKNLDTILELTNDAPEYVKKKIEILKKAGRTAEIEAEKAKLPAAEETKITADEFAEARKLDAGEKEKARVLYREAFGKLLENPLNGEMKTADIAAYANSMREAEPLDKIDESLWNLREKLIEITDESDSTDAGEARNRLNILDGAMTESIGNITKNYGTDEELAALHENWRAKIEKSSFTSDKHKIVSLVQDLSVRAGFGDLEEAILRKKIEESVADSDKEIYVRHLINFYNERGAYQKTFDALEKYRIDDLPLEAETARTVGNREKELGALRAIYWKPAGKIAVSNDGNVARFLEILHAENREELQSIAEKSSTYQLQLINFLLGKGERELAHQAIETADLSQAWKASRHAETSLALREFDDAAECFFCAALQFDSIGNLIRQTSDKKHFLINDDWFRLTREYGEWLFEKQDKAISPSKFLTAMTENQPDNPDEQSKLGEFYLRKKEFGKAIEHLRLAIETENLTVADETKLTTLGAAYYLAGDEKSAETTWAKVLTNEKNMPVESGRLYFDVLREHGLSRQAREKMPPIIIGFLENGNAENSEEFQELIRKIVASFENETEKAKYFRQILEKRPTDKSLAAMLLNENLIAQNEQREFYELLISRATEFDEYDSDYQFTAVRRRFFGGGDAESIYEQESNYKIEDPENERVEWQRKYLERLLEQRKNSRIKSLIAAIEKDLNERYARLAWLRLAKINLQIREKEFDRTEAERFIGIAVSDSATEIKPPNLERFNEVRRLLTAEKHDAEAVALSEAFFARMLALGQFDAANFTGLARAFFQKNDTERGLRVLQLMVDAGDEATRETASAEISALEIVKARSTDAAKTEENETALTNQFDALKYAAEISFEFNRIDSAIAFRRRLLETNPNDSINKIELAKLLAAQGE